MGERRDLAQHDHVRFRKRFGAIVRAFRHRLGVSQEELAWRADMHRTYLAGIERGARNISMSSLVRLVSALEVTLSVFFFAVEEHFQSPIDVPAPPGRNGKHAPARAAKRSRRPRERQRA